jgi:hypothetical protein
MVAALKFILAENPQKGSEARKLIGWTDFSVGTSLKGSKLIYETFYQGRLYRTVQYIFDRPGKKLIITGTSNEADKAATDVVFDNMVKTLKVWGRQLNGFVRNRLCHINK